MIRRSTAGRATLRRGMVALALFVAVTAAVLLVGTRAGHGRTARRDPDLGTAARVRPRPAGHLQRVVVVRSAHGPRRKIPTRHLAVKVTALRISDPTRTISISGGRVPRSFELVVRYPEGVRGRFPLVVFGHGYAVTPTPYAGLLSAWSRAGYVVAAPIFPLENANAPGGPNEQDLVNQPGDMSLVISTLSRPRTAAQKTIAGRVDLRRIAVSGQSDGGDTALAVAYDPAVRDRRIGAALILSGAEDPFARPFAMPADGPPLLAIQGTADTVNPPAQTYAFFSSASRPKYLLKLWGAGHLPPYTDPGSELTTVEHMTIAFLNRYLKHGSRSLSAYSAAGSAGPGSRLTARP